MRLMEAPGRSIDERLKWWLEWDWWRCLTEVHLLTAWVDGQY